ncbi:MAG: hypothetical protein VCC04_03740, partial [Myxococcota bacterium]
LPSVRATVKRIDLRHAPRRAKWRRGDGIRYIPKRVHVSPKYQAHLERVKPRPAGDDPLLQIQRDFPQWRSFDAPDLNQDGLGFTGATPPDPVLDVGPSYVIQAVNTTSGSSFNIYDKSDGTLVVGPLSMESLASGNSDCGTGNGDPIVLYDEMAGRWLLSEFSDFGNKMCVYISISADPIQGGWYAYEFEAPSFPDYPKYAVWPDGYYVGTNEFPTPALYVMDRQAMLAGNLATMQSFAVPSLAGFAFQMLNPADHDGAAPPPVGSPGYFLRHVDDEAHDPNGASASQDYLEIYEVSVNWTTPNASQLSGPTALPMVEFDSDLCGLLTFSCLPQPNGATGLDPLREVVMWRPQYRNMGTHESIVGSQVTDTNGFDAAGVRWWELRKTGAGPWTLHQEGTYSPDSHNRWMSSIAMDKDGNIALGYSVGSSSLNAGIRYTGRLSTDPAGVMTQSETTIANGGSQQWNDRWGDYSSMNVDPSDGCTFWYTNEYMPAGGNGNWTTKIASFAFDECLGGTVSLSGTNLNQAICANGDLSPIEVDVVGLGGFVDDVTLSLQGLPSDVTGTFSSNPVTPGDSSVLQMSVGTAASPGTHIFEIVGSATGVPDAVLQASVGIYTSTLAGEAPSLTSPSSGSTVDTSTPTFSWSSVAQAASYTLEVDDDMNFGSIDYSWTGTATSHKMVWGLNPDIVYNWRVRVTNPCGSDTSGSWPFDISLPDSYCRVSNLPIPDSPGAAVNDLLEITDADSIQDLQVELVVTHSYVGDLDISLTHLNTETVAQLIDRPGVPASGTGCSNPDIDVTLSDDALNDVEDQCDVNPPALSGTLRPDDLLSVFDGEDINGTWQLALKDHEFADVGELVSWCLVPELAPEPGAGLMLMSGILLMAAERTLRRRLR